MNPNPFDALKNFTFPCCIDTSPFHLKQKTLATVTTVQQAGRFGALNLENNKVVDFVEKRYTEGGWINGGFFVLSPKVGEYIEEDETVLAQMHAALKPRGFIVISVPQHAWLWSSVDQHACHVRRYSAAELHKKINCAGFEIMRSTSFVTTLLPAMILSRALQKKISEKKFDPEKELKISPWLNKLFFKLLKIELFLIKNSSNLPIGGSRLVIARKIG